MKQQRCCPLCQTDEATLFFSRVDKTFGDRIYYHCEQCDLVFLSPELRLSQEEEKARYAHHENDPNHKGYVQFLNQLLDPLKEKISRGAKGLDYGCGPGPTVKILLEREGYAVSNYDPYFFPETEVLNQRYDFVTCTEVIEHVYSPQIVFENMLKVLKDNGILAVMTQVRYDKINFDSWWYHQDPTHICFFSNQTFAWLANRFNLKWESKIDNVIFFKK